MNTAAPRVKSGLPWWVIALLLVGVVIVAAQFFARTQTKDPAEAFLQIREMIEAGEGDARTVTSGLNLLRQTEGYEPHLTYVDAVIASRRSREPKAVRLFKTLLEHPELQVGSYRHLGECFARLADYDQAIASFRKSIELAGDEESAEPRMRLAQSFNVLGCKRAALKEVEALLAIRPDDKDAIGLKGDLYFDLEEYAAAIEAFSGLYQTDGDYSAANPEQLDSYVSALIRTDSERFPDVWSKARTLIQDATVRSAGLLKMGDEDQQRQFSDQMKAAGPQDLDGKFVTVAVTLNDGNAALARTLLREFIGQRPRSRMGLELALQIFKKLGQQKEADLAEQNLKKIDEFAAETKTLIEAIGEDVSDPDLRMAVADNLINQGRVNESFDWMGSYDRVAREKGLPSGQSILSSRKATYLPIIAIPGFLDGNTDEDSNGDASENSAGSDAGNSDDTPKVDSEAPAKSTDTPDKSEPEDPDAAVSF